MSLEISDVLKWAYIEVNAIQAASADAIACDPDPRKLFLDLVHSRLPNLAEPDALHRLLNLRKRSLLPQFHQVR